jgi:hypothetical protein
VIAGALLGAIIAAYAVHLASFPCYTESERRIRFVA